MERQHFDDELRTLKQRLLNMGALVEERVHQAVLALLERRSDLAEQVVAGDSGINDLQIEVDDRCLKILALQQPMASDLRLITSAMKINADLERMGDQAVNIAQNVLRLLPHAPLKPVVDVEIGRASCRERVYACV